MAENNRVNHKPVADDVRLAIMKYPRGDEVKHMLYTVELNGVSGIGTALEPRNNIILRC